MIYTTEGVKALLRHEVQRLEQGGDPLPDDMYVGLLKEALAHLHNTSLLLYSAQSDREKAEKAYKETFRDLQAAQSELSMLKTIGRTKEQAYVIHEPPLTNKGVEIADINTMVQRFLQWELPDDFHPDNGISFEKTFKGASGKEFPRKPVGTNLFTSTQARAMVKHMLGIKE